MKTKPLVKFHPGFQYLRWATYEDYCENEVLSEISPSTSEKAWKHTLQQLKAGNGFSYDTITDYLGTKIMQPDDVKSANKTLKIEENKNDTTIIYCR